MFPLLKASQASLPIDWRVLAVLLISFTMLMRLSFMGIVDLLPEEAYYWAYAQNLDFSYFDHPPMVAWLIWLGTTLLGNTEVAVRISSCLCSLVAATYLFGLAYNLYGKTAAYVSAMLLAVLPIYFSVGFVMAPDAPLYAAWAATLYYFERAFLGGRSKSWIGVGICLGLGMLSKYTIALLGPTAMVFTFVDSPSRRWYLRPEPYLAGLIAALIFSPVLYWNVHHDWASFAFQGPNRWSGKHQFALHLLLGTALAQLTPFGLVGILAALGIRLNPATSDRPLDSGHGLWPWAFARDRVSSEGKSSRGRPERSEAKSKGDEVGAQGSVRGDPRRRFVTIFTLVPLFVFVLHSLQNSPKLNWTGPVWLAALPLLAHHLVLQGYGLRRNLFIFSPRIWKPTLLSLPLLYGGFLCCLHFGVGWLAPKNKMLLPIAWAEMARLVEEIETPLDEQSKGNMIVVGMDKYSISSELAFYDLDGDGMGEMSGQHLFGENSLMWAFWKPSLSAQGKLILMVGFGQEDLQNPALAKYFERVGPILEQRILKNGRSVGQFFYRAGYGYRADNPEKPSPKQVVSLNRIP